MNLILDNLLENNIVCEPEWCSSDNMINGASQVSDHLKDVDFIRFFYAYKDPWKFETDIFQYLKPESLERLRSTRCILIVDISLEGWGPQQAPIAISLHNSCAEHHIDPRKIFYLTSNHRESVCYSNFLIHNGQNIGINIVETVLISELSWPKINRPLDFFKDMAKRYHSDKIFLQLSRRNRSHRTLANYLVSKSECYPRALLSQDVLTDQEHLSSPCHDFDRFNPAINQQELSAWSRDHLPMVADSTEFQVNWATNNSRIIYHKTLFSVILETSVKDAGGTSLFISEKTFRAMAMRHPLIIFGHKNSNYFLRDLGFRTYEQWFDIDDIEYETNTYFRYKKILSQVEGIVKHLGSQSIQERIKWRFMAEDVLNYNYEKLHSQNNIKVETEKLHKTVLSYFQNNFISYFRTDF